MIINRKKVSVFCASLLCLAFADDASARLNNWSHYYSNSKSTIPNWGVYMGLRAYSSSMSSKKTENNLKGKLITKEFFRKICEDPADATQKAYCGGILIGAPTDGDSGSVTVQLDFSNEQFTTQEMEFQSPGFSAIIGAKLGNGIRMEVEAGAFSTSSSSGGLFSKSFSADLSGLNDPQGGNNADPIIPGLDNYPINVGIGFDAELERSILGLNIIYDLDIGDLKPFVGVGFAYTSYATNIFLNSSDSSINESLVGSSFADEGSFSTSKNKFYRMTYSLMGGLTYPLSDLIIAEVGYKHTFGGNLDWKMIKEGSGANSAIETTQPVMTVKDVVFQEVFFGLKMNF